MNVYDGRITLKVEEIIWLTYIIRELLIVNYANVDRQRTVYGDMCYYGYKRNVFGDVS
jgi:hypothetical protein